MEQMLTQKELQKKITQFERFVHERLEPDLQVPDLAVRRAHIMLIPHARLWFNSGTLFTMRYQNSKR